MSERSLAAGRRPVLEAVRSGRAREVLLAAGARRTPGLREVLAAAEEAGVAVTELPRERIEALAGGGGHQGALAWIAPLPSLSEGDLEHRPWGEEARVVVLDGVTDPQNVGAVARTAEAAGAEALVVRRRRGAAVGTAAIKASAGALLHLPVAEVANLARALRRLRNAGFWAIGLAGDAPTALDDADPPPGRLVIVLGSEGEGLSRLVREGCDELLAIPLGGRVRSLNVAAAAAVALFAPSLRAREG